MTGGRRDELAANLSAVQQRIHTAATAAGRPPAGVTLVVVTKYFPASDIARLRDLGVRHVAENRHQEALGKRQQVGAGGLTWHFTGRLQRNKAAAVGGWADVVQSVDRPELVAPLARAAHQRDRPVEVLVQVRLDDQPGRGGVAPDEADALARELERAEGLVLRGVMGVAPQDGDPALAFARLAAVGAEVRRGAPGATWLSAGMSGDLEAALAAGATHVRVGTAVLGNRPTPG